MEDVKASDFRPDMISIAFASSVMASNDLHAAFWNQPPEADCPCPGDCFAIAAEQSAGGLDGYGSKLRFHRDASQFVAFMQMESEETAASATGLKKDSTAVASPPDSMQPPIAGIPGYTSVTTTTVCTFFKFAQYLR
jgi:hypothetical protein